MTKIRKKGKQKTISSKHNPYQLSFNQELLLKLSDKPQILLLYLTLRRYAKWRYGSFKGLLKKLSHHERYVLLPVLVGMGLVKGTRILNHRSSTINKYGNHFVKIPNSINTKEKLKAFIVSVAETKILKTKYQSYKYNGNKRRDQANGYTVTKSSSSRNRQRYTSYFGIVTRKKIKELTGYALDTISRLRSLSLNQYGELLYAITWEEDNSSYHPLYNSYIHYFPKNLKTKIHVFIV